jgi:hypothetical protein
MGRPVFPFELNDQDFAWLISTFRENNPYSFTLECMSMPVVLWREGMRIESIASFEDEVTDYDSNNEESETKKER